MKNLRYAMVTLVVVSGIVVTVNGCAGQDEVEGRCNPFDPPSIARACLDAGPGNGDVDAGTDAEAGTSGARSQPTCPGSCVEGPSANNGGAWSEKPLLFREGPTDEIPIDCPDGLARKWLLYRDLVAPPATCDKCECEESKGICTGMPTGIEARAALMCDMAAPSTSFDGPAAWDGACTAENALMPQQECPPGSGVICAQSVFSPPMAGPSSESCKATQTPVPTFSVSTTWKRAGIACGGEAPKGSCDPDSMYCVRELGPNWMQCVWREGEHDACPENYNSARYVMYDVLPDDSRNCTDCTCGAPEGSGCLANLRLYDDGACASQFAVNAISSFSPQCYNIIPPGRPIGGKAITDISYMPGTCQVSGGEPYGEAIADAKTAVTFCCLPLLDI